MILAIDPGTNESAYLYWDGERLCNFDIVANETLLNLLRSASTRDLTCAIESLVNYGATVGEETFQTCLWAGRFYEAWHSRTQNRDRQPTLVNRRDIKLHHCGTARATDSSIREALIAKYGQPGTKRQPGPLYGMRSHLWSALAIATYITETRREAMSTAPREIAAP